MAEEFVSRRGKRTKVSQEEVVAPVATSEVQQESKRRRIFSQSATKRWRPGLHLSPRVVIVGLIILLLLVVIVIVAADSVKRDYEHQAVVMRNSIAAVDKNILSGDQKSSDVTASLLTSLGAVTDCKVAGLDVVSWYGPAKTARDDCLQTAARYQQLRGYVETMRSYALYLEQLDTILAPALAQPTDGQYAIASHYAEEWATAVDGLHGLTAPDMLSASHATLVARAEVLKSAWDKMQSSLVTRDNTGFKSAETERNKAYEDFRTIATDIQATISKLQESITSAQATPA